MKISCLAFVTAVVIAAAPASASPVSRSAQSCAQALALRMSAGDGHVPSYRFVYQGGGDGSPVTSFFAAGYTFDLQARDIRHGAELLRAMCVTDRSGNVLGLEIRPAGEVAPLRSTGL